MMDANEKKRLLALKQQTLDALAKKCSGRKCQVCDVSDWQVSGVFALAPALDVVSESTPSVGPNVVAVQCKTCGHLLLFDAKAVGIGAESSL
jgi:hypothetical protein